MVPLKSTALNSSNPDRRTLHIRTPDFTPERVLSVCVGVLLTDCDTRVRVGGLNEFFALMSDHPVGINLSGSFGVQVDHLELPEVGDTDGIILWTHVDNIWDVVVVKVVFAGVTSPIGCWKR